MNSFLMAAIVTLGVCLVYVLRHPRSVNFAVTNTIVNDIANSYVILVDYDQPLDEAVAAGHYNSVKRMFNWEDKFTAKQTGKAYRAVDLVCFNRSVSSEEAVSLIERMGYRPAEIHELLALGANYPEPKE